MHYALRYICHFLASNSRHGTHSPFVYALADQVIYNPNYNINRFIKFPEAFNAPYITLLGKILDFWGIDQRSTEMDGRPVRAVWLREVDQVDAEEILETIRQGQVLIIHEPYRKNVRRLWKQLTADSRVTVSINLFHFGLLLQREGQRKEDFLLRYPGTPIVKKLR